MADLALRDRLQPALLDRLLDDERTLAVVHVRTSEARLSELGLKSQGLLDILGAQGLRLKAQAESDGDSLHWQFTAPRAQTSPAALRSLLIKPPGATQGLALGSFLNIEIEVVRNAEVESMERRMISMRRLREYVYRDLGWLLNATSLDSTESLAGAPQVARSILNYGMPSFAGRATAGIDANEVALRLRKTIEFFEPRLSAVRVAAESRRADEDDGTLRFMIEAELWGQPVSQHLQLRTTIDVISGQVALTEAAGS